MQRQFSAGRLRHRCTIQTWSTTEGAQGQDVRVPVTLHARVAMRVNELTGRELYNAQQIQPDITMEVESRFITNVTSKMQLIWHDGTTDRTLAIEAPPINPDGKRRWMLLMCKEPK